MSIPFCEICHQRPALRYIEPPICWRCWLGLPPPEESIEL